MKEVIDYTGIVPLTPPQGLLEWCLTQGVLEKDFIIYRSEWGEDDSRKRKKRAVRITCSACHHTALVDRYDFTGGGCGYNYPPAPFGYIDPDTKENTWDGKEANCPCCGKKSRIYHISNITNWTWQDTYPTTVTRIGEKLCITGWCVIRKIGKDGLTTYETEPMEAYVIEEKRIIRLTAYVKFMSRVSFTRTWKQTKKYYDNWGVSPNTYILPFDPKILIGSTAENSKLDRYLKSYSKVYPLTYLRLWQRHPSLENLVVQGAGRIVAEMIDTDRSGAKLMYPDESKRATRLDHRINWKDQRPAQMLGLNKREFALLKKLKWECEDLFFYKDARDEKWNVRLPDDMPECKKAGYLAVMHITEYNVPVMPTVRYIIRQVKERDAGWRYLEDYWRMAEGNGLTLTSRSELFPKNLKTAHDRQAKIERDRLQKERADKLSAQFAKRLEQLSDYEYEKDGLLIRPAASYMEFINEGKALNHCVAGYADRHANGGTTLFWIRRAEKPDEPFFTLEFDIKGTRVCQNRGKHNCDRTPEVKAFEEAWLAWVKAGCPRNDADSPVEEKPRKSRKKKEATAA